MFLSRQIGPSSLLIVTLSLLLALSGLGCSKKSEPADTGSESDAARRKVANYLLEKAPEQFDVPTGVVIDDRVRVLGMDYSPKPIKRGQPVTVTIYFEALRDNPGDFYFYGHFEPVNQMPYRLKLDHRILNGLYPMRLWKKGDIIKDVYTTTFPEDFPDQEGVLYAGFYRGKQRLQVRGKNAERQMDADGRAIFGRMKTTLLVGQPEVGIIYNSGAPLTIDGKLDELAWKRAPELKPFGIADGTRRANPQSIAKILWYGKDLYIAITGKDTDLIGKQTDPEGDMSHDDRFGVVIDANSDREDFSILAINPAKTMYRRYFKSRLLRDETPWNPDIDVAVTMVGSLNVDDRLDQRWTVEMRIPMDAFNDHVLPERIHGHMILLNVFRFDANARGQASYSVWSPTLVDEPDRLQRAGRLAFSDKPVMELSPAERGGDPSQILPSIIKESDSPEPPKEETKNYEPGEIMRPSQSPTEQADSPQTPGP